MESFNKWGGGGGGWFKNYEFNIMEVHWKNWFLGGGGGGWKLIYWTGSLKKGSRQKRGTPMHTILETSSRPFYDYIKNNSIANRAIFNWHLPFLIFPHSLLQNSETDMVYALQLKQKSTTGVFCEILEISTFNNYF